MPYVSYRKVGDEWFLRSNSPLTPGQTVLVTKVNGSQRTERVGAAATDGAAGFYLYKIVREQPATEQQSIGDMAGIVALFNTARQHLRRPSIVLSVPGAMTVRISMAGAAARVPGSLNVVDHETRGWYGRVTTDGRFQQSGLLTSGAALIDRLRAFAANPAAVAAEHGRLTGRCCFCNLPLTDERSTAVGYGPVCAQHYGLAWGDRGVTATEAVARPEPRARTRQFRTRRRRGWRSFSPSRTWIREETEAAMQRMEAEGDRAETARDEANRHAARTAMEVADEEDRLMLTGRL